MPNEHHDENALQAVDNLARLGKSMGYAVEHGVSLSPFTENPRLSKKRLDLGFFQDNELKVAVEIESNFNKEVGSRNNEKLGFLNCKCLVLSSHMARRMNKHMLNALITHPDRMIKVTKRDYGKYFGSFVLLRILKFIEENPNTHIRGIAEVLKSHPETVRRMLKRVSEFIEFQSFSDKTGNLPNLPVLIKLKEGVTAEGISRYLRVRDKLKI